MDETQLLSADGLLPPECRVAQNILTGNRDEQLLGELEILVKTGKWSVHGITPADELYTLLRLSCMVGGLSG